MSAEEEKNKGLVGRFYEEIAKGNLDVAADLVPALCEQRKKKRQG